MVAGRGCGSSTCLPSTEDQVSEEEYEGELEEDDEENDEDAKESGTDGGNVTESSAPPFTCHHVGCENAKNDRCENMLD